MPLSGRAFGPLLAGASFLMGCTSAEPARLSARHLELSTSSSQKPSTARKAKKSPRKTETAQAELRIAALRDRVYIRRQPRWDSAELGVFRSGMSVRVQKRSPVSTLGCAGGWYAVEPEGFVCSDAGTTFDVTNHPLLRAKREQRTDFSADTPYSWSESLEAPLYRHLPNRDEQRGSEYAYEKRQRRIAELTAAVADGRQAAVEDALSHFGRPDLAQAAGQIPDLFRSRRMSPWSDLNTPGDQRAKVKTVPARSSIAWTSEFFADGRSWLVTSDLLLVPKDRTRLHRPSTFAGVHLGAGRARLPIAFIRKQERPKYRLPAVNAELAGDDRAVVPAGFLPSPSKGVDSRPNTNAGRLEESGQTWPRLGYVELTGRARYQSGVRYLETRDGGSFIRETDATIAESGVPVGFAVGEGEKWLDVSIDRGLLIAYEGLTPVFATLISPGMNGYRRVDGKPARGTTPTGVFRIEWKHRSTTMSPDPEKMNYYLSEVPYTQFFHMPFALHAVYWHDRFGEPKSGGCVNLSPKDAHWLFDWTTPGVPADWHGVRSGDARGKGTWVRVH